MSSAFCVHTHGIVELAQRHVMRLTFKKKEKKERKAEQKSAPKAARSYEPAP